MVAISLVSVWFWSVIFLKVTSLVSPARQLLGDFSLITQPALVGLTAVVSWQLLAFIIQLLTEHVEAMRVLGQRNGHGGFSGTAQGHTGQVAAKIKDWTAYFQEG